MGDGPAHDPGVLEDWVPVCLNPYALDVVNAGLGGTKCARGRRALVGVVRRTKGDKRFAQQSILQRMNSREEISQVRIIIPFPN